MSDLPERIWLWRNYPNNDLVISTPGQPYPTGSPEYIRKELYDAVVAERDALIRDRDRWKDEAQVNTSPIVAGLIAERANRPLAYGTTWRVPCNHDWIQANMPGHQQCIFCGTERTRPAPTLPAVQPDTAAIREAALRDCVGLLLRVLQEPDWAEATLPGYKRIKWPIVYHAMTLDHMESMDSSRRSDWPSLLVCALESIAEQIDNPGKDNSHE